MKHARRIAARSSRFAAAWLMRTLPANCRRFTRCCARARTTRSSLKYLAQSDAYHVRGIALTPTQGLARGMVVEDTGGPLKAPVGKGILSRMFDVFGDTIDRGAALSDVQWRSVHRDPPPLARRSTKSEIFETGIKVIDVLMPLERGGKAGFSAARAWIRRCCLPR